jgi:hypothetical protein
MKRLKISLSIAAMVLGLTAAFAFKAPTKQFTSYWFDTDSAGVPIAYDPDGQQCFDTSGNPCGKLYDASKLNFSGGTPVSVISGDENMQIQTALLRH